ncbi:antitoxin [Nonomuraea sp. SBT364]|uniref:antitoxin n=1 Tax=Nonomuraea sp. SBT364 TaxID=1580530 RepID=UPI00066DEECA|nr:antitoxin [Nonomuraea sp. SBT364]
MGIKDWIKKAEELAEEHPAETAEILDKAEEFVENDTGHKYDKQIQQGLDEVKRTMSDDSGQA